MKVVPDGSGGLWIPVLTGFSPPVLTMLHYSGGQLRQVPLPLPGSGLRMTVAHVPGSTVTAFYGGSGLPKEALILKYGG